MLTAEESVHALKLFSSTGITALGFLFRKVEEWRGKAVQRKPKLGKGVACGGKGIEMVFDKYLKWTVMVTLT